MFSLTYDSHMKNFIEACNLDPNDVKLTKAEMKFIHNVVKTLKFLKDSVTGLSVFDSIDYFFPAIGATNFKTKFNVKDVEQLIPEKTTFGNFLHTSTVDGISGQAELPVTYSSAYHNNLAMFTYLKSVTTQPKTILRSYYTNNATQNPSFDFRNGFYVSNSYLSSPAPSPFTGFIGYASSRMIMSRWHEITSPVTAGGPATNGLFILGYGGGAGDLTYEESNPIQNCIGIGKAISAQSLSFIGHLIERENTSLGRSAFRG